MSKRFFAAICIILFLILSSSINAGTNSLSSRIFSLTGNDFSSSEPLNYVPGELLVKYKPQLSLSSINSLHSQWNVTEIKRFSEINVHHIKLPSGTNVEDALKAFKDNPSVEYAEPNYIYKIDATTPNDTYFTNLWGMHNTGQIVSGTAGTAGADIKASEAWDIATGNSAITVAVIDSGVDYNHPDLTANISATRYDFVNNDGNPMDSNDHGTHVAGTIAATGNNTLGVAGVTWSTTIIPIRAADANGLLTASNIISAIDYARTNGAKIINASFGGTSFSQATYDAISNARTAGILFVAAAGNDGTSNDTTPHYPASYSLDNIISVAATDQNDALYSFSNYGATSVHVGAPGINIYSTKPARQNIVSYNFDSGSMGSWTTGGTNNNWGLSSSQHNSGSYSLAVSPSGNYQNNSNSWALAPVLNLSSHIGAKLTFYLKGQSETNYDYLYVETSTDGSTWTSQGYVTGSLASWTSATVDLGAYDGQSSVYLRFRFTSDFSNVYTGWFIDDITITAASTSYSGTDTDYYQFISGTSMATPHVAGLAALIWGYKTSLTYSQVKDIILRSVDTKSSLSGKMTTGGRVNALNALYYVVPQAPSSLTATTVSSSGINLTWIDNSLNESGFKIERKTGSSGTYAQIATANANATSYSDTGLSAETTYYYRIVSYTDFGSSSYSNEANATTSATSGGGGGGGCFIATAAFGSPMEKHVQILRDFRDRILLKSSAGKAFVQFYYRKSPPIADKIAQSESLRFLTRIVLMPVIGVAYLIVNFGALATLLLITFIVLTLIFSVRTARRKIHSEGDREHQRQDIPDFFYNHFKRAGKKILSS